MNPAGLRNFFGLCFIEPRAAIWTLMEIVDPVVVEEALDGECPDCLPEDRLAGVLEQMLTDYILHPVLALSMDTAGPAD